jgi:hypothetical protein
MRIRKHLTYANVAATVALFGVLAGGGAYAASKIGSKDLERGAVTRPKLQAQAVSSGKIADRAVGSTQLSEDVPGVALMGVTAENGRVVSYFNRLGQGPPRIEGMGTGEYAIFFPGADTADVLDLVDVAVTRNADHLNVSYDSCSGYCMPVHPVVTTYNADGSRANGSFTYVAYAGQP